jgi:hypothetical protein
MAEEEKAFYVSGVEKEEHVKGSRYLLSLIELSLEDAQSITKLRANIEALERLEARHLNAVKDALGTTPNPIELEEKTKKSLGIIEAVPRELKKARAAMDNATNDILPRYRGKPPTHEAYSMTKVEGDTIVTKVKGKLLGLTPMAPTQVPKPAEFAQASGGRKLALA